MNLPREAYPPAQLLEGTLTARGVAESIRVMTRTLAVLTMTLAAGCAINTTAVRSDQPLDPGSAYLYGRFVIKTMPSNGLAQRPASQTVGLLLACDDGSTYPLYFSEERTIRVIKIRPASCSVKEIHYVDDMKLIVGRKSPSPEWSHTDYFAAGHGYYLGDFSAVAQWEIVGTYPMAKDVFTWDLDAVDGQFTQTSTEFRRTFAALGAMPIHDQRVSPERPAAKRGLAGSDEPTMSPERISRLAGLIKSTFPSLAACSTACPKGECLPYRAPSGAAMTCINHCMTSSDCPDGMVCNCSRRADVDCLSVASTPGDPMEGICMPRPAPANPPTD